MEIKRKEERKKEIELKRLKRMYKYKPRLLSATLNKNKTLVNLPHLLQQFKFSNSPKSYKSPKNPFMVNKSKPLNMSSLWNEITKMNKK